jgi:hypothetical protein
MRPKIVYAEYVQSYIIHLRFFDGTEGEMDPEPELYGEVFEPLKDIQFFKRFNVHPDFHTLRWPNGADIAPEFLYEKTLIPA